MNYIKQLQKENKDLRQALTTVDDMIIQIEHYLLSSKFHQDTTVQIADVLLRLDEVRSEILKGE